MNVLNKKHLGQIPPGAVYIGRPPRGGSVAHHWGNPFTHLSDIPGTILVKDRATAVQAFEDWIEGRAWQHVEPSRRAWIIDNLYRLRGKDLVCWCAPLACHGTYLMNKANEGRRTIMNVEGLPFTGIGSRSTPPDILVLMQTVGQSMAKHGLVLRSGAAAGADTAFEQGCDQQQGGKEIFLPWNGFEAVRGSGLKRRVSERGVYALSQGALTPQLVYDAEVISARYHPNWAQLTEPVRALHTRNVFQILGPALDKPTAFVVFWAPEVSGKVQGGTGQAIRLAQALNIPTFNLLHPQRLEVFIAWFKALKKK